MQEVHPVGGRRAECLGRGVLQRCRGVRRHASRHGGRDGARHWILTVPWLRPGTEGSGNRLDLPGQIPLGRTVQRRDEAADVRARLQIRRECGASDRTGERAVSTGGGEGRSRARRHETRRMRTDLPRLSSHGGGPGEGADQRHLAGVPAALAPYLPTTTSAVEPGGDVWLARTDKYALFRVVFRGGAAYGVTRYSFDVPYVVRAAVRVPSESR